MSGIYIPGMEMPKRDHLVFVEIDENGDVFAAYDGGLTKLAQYKAIIVPDHGRLIDADKLLAKDRQIYDGTTAVGRRFFILEDEVKEAPTIIPASKEGET